MCTIPSLYLIAESTGRWSTGGDRRADGRPHVGVIKRADVRWVEVACFSLCLPSSVAFEAVKSGLHAPASALIIIRHAGWPVCHNLSFKNTLHPPGFKSIQLRDGSNGQAAVVSYQLCKKQTRVFLFCTYLFHGTHFIYCLTRHHCQFAVWIQLYFGNTGSAGSAFVGLASRCPVRLDWFLCCRGSSQGFKGVGHLINPSRCWCVFGVSVHVVITKLRY